MSEGRLNDLFASRDVSLESVADYATSSPGVLVDAPPEALTVTSWDDAFNSLRALAETCPTLVTGGSPPSSTGEQPIFPGGQETRPCGDVWLQRVPNPPRVDAELMDQGFREAQAQWRRERQWRRIMSNVVLLAGLLVAGWCFWQAGLSAAHNRATQALLPEAPALAGTSQRRLVTKPIGEVRLGERFVGINPARAEVDLSIPDVDPENSLEVHLTQRKHDGMELRAKLIRTRDWNDLERRAVGDSVPLDLPEMGAVGKAKITFIGPCPEIEPDDGTGRNVCTGFFEHFSSGNLLNVQFASESTPMGVTDNHRFWSVDRREHVAVGKLKIGEKVDIPSGTTAVVSIEKRPRDEPVFNLEIHREHVFRVGESGILVHNTYGANSRNTIRPGSFSIRDWSGYPSSVVKPSGPFRRLTGAEYDSARKAANQANAALRKADPAKYAGKQIHEIHPVKYGGSPTDPANKIALTPAEHAKFTAWWNRLMHNLQD